MISLIALFPGLILLATGGWLGLRLLEGHSPVLVRSERWALGTILGLLYGMLLMVLLNVSVGVPFTRAGFLVILGGAVVLLLLLFLRQRLPWATPPVKVAPSPPLSRASKIVWSVLIGWIVLRTLVAGIDFLVLSPTFADDTLDNWNLRGKVFFLTRSLTLLLPHENPATSAQGISSYPPSLPLMKTWLSSLWGSWSEPLVNSIHLLWYVAALVLVFAALRRSLSRPWALLGVYVLGSLPLFLIHGTNTYADAFLAAHVFAAVSLLFQAFRTEHEAERWTFLKLAAVAAAILPFAKNEGLLVYLLPLLLLLLWQLLWSARRGSLDRRSAARAAVFFALALLLVTGPWLAFKWSNALTFGNAKPFTSLGLGWQENVLYSILYNTFFEGNWLLLFPLFFALLIWQWRRAFSSFAILTVFVLIVYVGQVSLYLFTGLATEALRQTGYARGLVHIAPTVVFLTVLLLHEGVPQFLATLRRRAD